MSGADRALCFVCGLHLEAAGRVALTGHPPSVREPDPALPGRAEIDPTLRLHRGCATHLAAEILQALLHEPRKTMQAVPLDRAGLTPAEQRVLIRIVAGDSNKEIAYGAGVAEKTVKNMVSVVLSKLEVRSRTEAAVVAIRAGLLE
jgi:DNA-binding NarL/FixJ family response regulator